MWAFLPPRAESACGCKDAEPCKSQGLGRGILSELSEKLTLPTLALKSTRAASTDTNGLLVTNRSPVRELLSDLVPPARSNSSPCVCMSLSASLPLHCLSVGQALLLRPPKGQAWNVSQCSFHHDILPAREGANSLLSFTVSPADSQQVKCLHARSYHQVHLKRIGMNT